MARIRLTSKTKIANDPSDMEGTRQDCGKRTRYQKYDNFDLSDDIGGRGKADTDGSKLYEGDRKLRNQMHVTEIRLKQAKMWQRSKLATKLAMYLLGEKAPQGMIKAQAAEFLSLGNEKLAKAVSRWAKTEYLYAGQGDNADTPAETPAETPADTSDKKPAETPAETPDKTPDKKPAKESASADTSDKKPAETPAETPDKKPADTPVSQGAATDGIDPLKLSDASASCPNCGSSECAGCASDPQAGIVEEGDPNGSTDFSDSALASLFEESSNTLVANNKEAKSKKVGVQQFEQPQRVASNKLSLDQLWKGAPDLSNIFN